MTGGSQGRAHMSATSREVAGAGERVGARARPQCFQASGGGAGRAMAHAGSCGREGGCWAAAARLG